MTISVLVPAYNAETTVGATIESVLRQTTPADEILVMDDGSTDQTAAVLSSFGRRITVFSQPNRGLSSARNELLARARGDLIAFLDSDDLWHPNYLSVQRKLFERFPKVAAFFIEHSNFSGFGSYDWSPTSAEGEITIEVLEPLAFLLRYRIAPGPFVMSFCCVPRRVLNGIGPEPFKLRISEDVYFCNLLPFWGPVALASGEDLAAYRVREGSLASNRLNCLNGEVRAYELLEDFYKHKADASLVRAFERTFASRRRELARILLGVGRAPEARVQLFKSLRHSSDPDSVAKSLALISLSCFPRALQPQWPAVDRQWRPTAKD